MDQGPNTPKRPPRKIASPEEVKERVMIKKVREHKKIEKFKKTHEYKCLNLVNVLCMCVYLELIICFYGPCKYFVYYNKKVEVEFGGMNEKTRLTKTKLIKINSVNNKLFTLMIDDYIEAPKKFEPFQVGYDFILNQEIKAAVSTSPNFYRLNDFSPVLFLSFFVAGFTFIFYFYNLNFNNQSLQAVSFLNGITLLAFLCL
jgi:hypothetical protein